MGIVLTRTLRGAVAGVAGASVWAAQQPLDQRVFGVPYSDTELLGKWVTREPAWRPLGVALHLFNGAAFGAIYANLPRVSSVPAWARGPAAAVAEHLATWPGTAAMMRMHPAGAELPELWRSGPAFAQGLWRHLLFGVVLGEVERRLNPPASAPPAPVSAASAETNGHGTAEHLLAVVRG